MGDIIVIVIIIALVSIVIFKLIKDKKKGNGCCGCPSANSCSKKPNDEKK